MFKNLAIAFLASLSASAAAGPAVSPTASQTAQGFASNLSSVGAVEFYFLSRTEEWDYRPSEIISNSTIRLYRACGGNCARVMEPVLSHLREAKSRKCMPGMQDALVRGVGGWVLVYSYSGRQIRYGRSCYWNETGIRDVVRDSNVEFGGNRAARPAANNSFKPKPLRGSA